MNNLDNIKETKEIGTLTKKNWKKRIGNDDCTVGE